MSNQEHEIIIMAHIKNLLEMVRLANIVSNDRGKQINIIHDFCQDLDKRISLSDQKTPLIIEEKLESINDKIDMLAKCLGVTLIKKIDQPSRIIVWFIFTIQIKQAK